jgi:hypothetical protein
MSVDGLFLKNARTLSVLSIRVLPFFSVWAFNQNDTTIVTKDAVGSNGILAQGRADPGIMDRR